MWNRSRSIASDREHDAHSHPAPTGDVRIGVGGWTYELWRNNFYPSGLSHAKELEFASRRLTAIEINATYYRTQSATSFAKWHNATPDDFVFSLKASRYTTNRRVLAEAGESIARFIDSGIAELGRKLGPIVWQFAPTKKYEPDDFEAFLELLPKTIGTLPLRHAMEVRHSSFAIPDYVALARRHGVATVFADSDDYPSFADTSSDFVYARLMRTVSAEPTGYTAEAIADWKLCAESWSVGSEPESLPRVAPQLPGNHRAARDVYLFFISGAKERAPAAAMALLEATGRSMPVGD